MLKQRSYHYTFKKRTFLYTLIGSFCVLVDYFTFIQFSKFVSPILANPLGYSYGTFSSNQKIPATAAWALTFSNNDLTASWGGSSYDRRIVNQSGTNSSAFKGFGVYNNSSGSAPTINGSSANTTHVQYPVYCWVFTSNASGQSSYTFSWTDYGTSAGGFSQTGFDDFQDGSGMGDTWTVRNSSQSAVRGKPSFLMLQ